MVYNKNGAVLVVILFLIFFLSLFVIGIANLMITDFQIAQNNKFSTKAYYVAEAGVERAIYELRQDNNWNAGFNQVQFPQGEDSSYTVTATHSPGPFVLLDSTSTLNGAYQRRIIARVRVIPSGAPYPVSISSWTEAIP